MQTKTPCTDYIETKGLIYFARMLDKIRLKAGRQIAAGLFYRCDEDPTDVRRALHEISRSRITTSLSSER